MIIKNALGAGMVLELWNVNANLVMRGFVEVHNSEPDGMIRILEVCQESKVIWIFNYVSFLLRRSVRYNIYSASDCC